MAVESSYCLVTAAFGPMDGSAFDLPALWYPQASEPSEQRPQL